MTVYYSIRVFNITKNMRSLSGCRGGGAAPNAPCKKMKMVVFGSERVHVIGTVAQPDKEIEG